VNKKLIILGLAASAFGATALFSGKTLAYRGDPAVKGPNYTEGRHEAMTKAFEAKDYSAWKALMQSRGRVSQVINEQNFGRFADAHRLMLEGNTDEANKIKEELGLRLHSGLGKECGQGMGKGYGMSN